MLPLIQAEEIKHSVVEYLKATFNFSDKALETAFSDFLLNKRNGMCRGPYLQIKLPFAQIPEEEAATLEECLHIRPDFSPYQHQFEAFQRLSTRNSQPEPVVLTTGTGSGKTESFLYPLLDYCYQHRDKPGIKAIILYPMNALATDQARRLAEIIYNYKDQDGNYILRSTLRAGLFIGEGKQKKGAARSTRMGPDHIIEDRNTLVATPPDILFTNFKMLDFSLMQARFHDLWKQNLENKELLKFLVLDELHTYDGAKGSDVANLVRRLKLKLGISIQQLVPIGTSATMSGGEDGKVELIKFVSQVFGVNVNKDSIIEEQRLTALDFFFPTGSEELITPVILKEDIELCEFKEKDNYHSYIEKQLNFWNYKGLSPEMLASSLMKNQWLYELLLISGNGIKEVDKLKEEWAEKIDLTRNFSSAEIERIFGSLICLLSYAKNKSGNKLFPFLYVQVTYWTRSLYNTLRKMQTTPFFEWESDSNDKDTVMSLPPYFCRECGASGWIGIKKEYSFSLERDLQATRHSFMADRGNKNIYFISSLQDKERHEIFASEYAFTGEAIEGYINPSTLQILDKKEADNQFKIIGVRRQNGDRIEKVCPHCNAQNTLALIGTGLPTIEAIATARILSTTTDVAPDKQRKLLIFTNGVQDAAHQAGFIENRNFRFGMRHAIQSTIRKLDKAIPLPEFYSHFESYWKEHTDNEASDKLEAYYYKFLPPDCESSIRIEDYRNKDKSFKAVFDKEFFNRMTWEIWSEFSYNASIGRTLEKSGASGVSFDTELMQKIYFQLQYWLKGNELGERITEESFLKFLNGFLHRLRLRGGVDHLYLDKFRSEKTSYYLIKKATNKKYFLIRDFGQNTRLPRFITLQGGPHTTVFDVLQTTVNHNWYSTYFIKSFPLVRKEEAWLINDFYGKMVELLDANRLLDKKVASGVTNYGISQDQVKLTGNIQGYSCTACGHQIHSGKENAPITKGMACLQYRCPGSYEPIADESFDYYRMVYNRGKFMRIFAQDHTGLIDRDRREQLEKDFKNRPSYRSPNVLVATSTLEMGIDIGDLNVTFNASLPPETANYLQRTGRAGRASGTSLVVNLAGRDEHDLYYFQEPLNMMNGEIRTPACYLEAKDILKRHFMAFCFDCWASQDPQINKIPFVIRNLSLKSKPIGDSSFIFNKIVNFVNPQKQSLFSQFIEQYKGEYGINDNADVILELKKELVSGELLGRLDRIHDDLLTEIRYYEEKRNKAFLQRDKLPKSGKETEDLSMEIRALSGAINNVNQRNTIEYLTNIGILPNYAFPETGVILNAQVRRKQEIDGKIEYKYEAFGNIVRPSSSAITELAPANTFYSQGYKLLSDGIEILSKDQYEVYRFCSNCDQMEKSVNVPASQTNCPKCGHGSWSALTNRKTLVKLRTVLSVNDNEKSKITDSSDDRERKSYQKSIHIQTEQNASKGALILKRVPFGIEFFTKAKLIEINTGIREEGFYGSREIEIDGEKYPEVGFVICKTCGKTTERPLTQNELDNRTRSYHFGYCSNKAETYKGHPDELFEEIYLYREFFTEALKILLPVQNFKSEEQIAVFCAGLMLGLKGYYKGHPDHVRIKEYEEFHAETQRKERYLVMYETIPGGTGYLSKLFDKDEFTELLKIAYSTIRLCTCKDEGKDGCYRCIYTYGNQYERRVLSRKMAEELFAGIIDQSGEWNIVDSLKGQVSHANKEESELEMKFIELLRNKVKNWPGWEFEENIFAGTKCYRLNISRADCNISWQVLPQNLYNNLQGIKLKTRPDFVFKCLSLQLQGINADIVQLESIKEIALYLDGYEFHATRSYPRLPSDIKIRNEIVDSSRYHVWVLTWEDMINGADGKIDTLGGLISQEIIDRLKGKHPLVKRLETDRHHWNNNFTRFIELIMAPMGAFDMKLWSGLLFFSCQRKLLERGYDAITIDHFATNNQLDISLATTGNPTLYAYIDKIRLTPELNIEIFVHPQSLECRSYSYYNDNLHSWEKGNWQLFWEIYNLTQFSGIKSWPERERLLEMSKEHPDIWEILLGNFETDLHPIVRALINAGIPVNKDGYFDLVKENRIIAEAELGSHERKFVIRPLDEVSAALFKTRGYRLIDHTKFDINEIIK